MNVLQDIVDGIEIAAVAIGGFILIVLALLLRFGVPVAIVALLGVIAAKMCGVL